MAEGVSSAFYVNLSIGQVERLSVDYLFPYVKRRLSLGYGTLQSAISDDDLDFR
jgi:hypothetical protein